MIPYQHQLDMADKAYNILAKYMLVYLASEERTGKTLSAILTAEKCNNVKKVLVITKAKAASDWIKTLNNYKTNKIYAVSSYQSLHKINVDYDLIILDEAHNYISKFPSVSKTWRSTKKLCANKPIIYISATPYPQGIVQLYNQLNLSSWSPWRNTKALDWFNKYGTVRHIKINGLQVPQYDNINIQSVYLSVSHLFLTKTRKELGFKQEPVDKVHYVTLSEYTSNIYNKLIKDKIYIINNNLDIVCDTVSKLRTTLHQLEGGTLIVNNDSKLLPNKEKIEYIKQNFGDSKDLVIMYNFRAELQKLKLYFKNAKLLQSTSYAEGIDLSEYKHLVIYSQDYSTARHTQRRARQCNLNREYPINVHFLLVKKAISEQVYKTVTKNKKNYVDSLFTGELI